MVTTVNDGRVWFGDGFWGHIPDRTRPGREVRLNTAFSWNGRAGLVPAVYLCGRGVVADVCYAVPAAEVDAFLTRAQALPPEEQERMAWENPLRGDFRGELTVNGRTQRARHGCAVGYLPHVPQGERNEPAALRLLERYGLDRLQAWYIRRFSIPWQVGRRPKRLRSVTLTLTPEMRDIPGPRFTAELGKQVACSDPEGCPVTLTVEETGFETLPESGFPKDGREYPRTCAVLTCSLTPPQPEDSVFVRDTGRGDRPRGRSGSGVIGGADGPVAVLVSHPGGESEQFRVCSALYFDPAPAVEWELVFRRRPHGPVTVALPAEKL